MKRKIWVLIETGLMQDPEDCIVGVFLTLPSIEKLQKVISIGHDDAKELLMDYCVCVNDEEFGGYIFKSVDFHE